jgi:hypothetical protein
MTPDTSFEFHVAYVLALVLYGGYAVTLWRRARRARERLQSPRASDGR